MQTLDVQASNPANAAKTGGFRETGGYGTDANGKTGAETARNGSSFLAMIEKMIAGAKDGKADAGRGAGDAMDVPGDENTLIKPEAGKAAAKARASSGSLKNAREKSLVGRTDGTGSAKDLEAASGEKPDIVDGAQGLNGGTKKTGRPSTGRGGKPEGLEPELTGNPVDDGNAGAEIRDKTDDTAALAALFAAREPAESPSARSAKGAASGIAALDGAAGQAGSLSEATPEIAGESPSGAKAALADRKNKKATIGVRDERSDGQAATNAESPLVKTARDNGDGTADMSISFRADGTKPQSIAGQEAVSAGLRDADGQSFATMLSQELRANAADFVKTGQIVLRDNNAGIIRLTLHPETLGNVKISLELSADKRISGKIVVNSQEAYDAFNESLDGLSRAFVESGFTDAGFDLSWSGQDSAGRGSTDDSGAVSSPFYAQAIPDVMSAGNAADTETSGYRYNGQSAINVLA